jgi:GT2 family glycosyltransferase/glycosyltransferase involved in cell wall biosynthesis
MRILLVAHGFPPGAMGGTEIYTHDLARALAARTGDEVGVFAREADAARADFDVRSDQRAAIGVTFVNNLFRTCRSFEETYRSPAIRRIGAAVLDEFRPDVVHVQHFTCLSTELVYEFAARRIPTIVTLNDYWLICHRGQLIDLDYQPCDGPYPAGCPRCIGAPGVAGAVGYRAASLVRGLEARLPEAPAGWLRRARSMGQRAAEQAPGAADESAKRLAHMREIAGAVDHFLAPSRTLRARFLDFGIPADRISYRTQGIDQTGFAEAARTTGDRLRVGFMGSLLVTKAPHLLLEAFAGLPQGSASLQIFGSYAGYHGDDRYRATLEPLIAATDLARFGPIAHAEVPSALASIDVLVVPSIWLENAPFVIREAFAAGVPVVASNFGGMAEMVEHERNGLLFQVGDAADLRRALQRLIDEPALLTRLRAGIPPVKTIQQDAAETREIYEQLVSRPPVAAARPAVPAGATGQPRVVAVVLNYKTPDDAILAVRSLEGSRRAFADIVVVDNASGDGSAERLRAALTGVVLRETDANLGFSGGCNVGIREGLARGADFVLLVNSDAILAPTALKHMLDAIDLDPATGIVAPILLSRGEPDRISSMGMVFSPRSGRMRHPDFGRSYEGVRVDPRQVVDAVSGCVMLIRGELLRRIGLLDERYFFSFEDLEFCLRARRAGYRSVIASRAVAYHQGSVSIGPRSARRLYFATRNHLLVASDEATVLPGAGLIRAAAIVGYNVALALTSGGASVAETLRSVGQGVWHHVTGRYGDGTSR